MNESILVTPDVDYNQALPIQQKRIIAFINHFIMNTVSFLNTFAQSCESRLMEFEFKLQKVDASLKIVESQLSSISDEHFSEILNNNLPVEINTDQLDSAALENVPEVIDNETSEDSMKEVSKIDEPNLKNDPIYSKYFKMVQVGVPVPAVKLKMQNEGLDPNILDKV